MSSSKRRKTTCSASINCRLQKSCFQKILNTYIKAFVKLPFCVLTGVPEERDPPTDNGLATVDIFYFVSPTNLAITTPTVANIGQDIKEFNKVYIEVEELSKLNLKL